MLEMEVMIASAGHPLFLEWLDYIRAQIASKPYAVRSSFWHSARARYVFHTTGPRCMNRFFKLPHNVPKLQRMGFLECNFHKHVDSLNENGKRVLDVISHSSFSYMTKVQEIRPPVGLGGQLLPPLPTPKRMRVKSAARRMSVSNAWRTALIGPQARSQLAAMLGAQARSQGDQAAASEANALVFVDGLFHSDINYAADVVVTCLAYVLIDVLLDSMTIAVDTPIQALRAYVFLGAQAVCRDPGDAARHAARTQRVDHSTSRTPVRGHRFVFGPMDAECDQSCGSKPRQISKVLPGHKKHMICQTCSEAGVE